MQMCHTLVVGALGWIDLGQDVSLHLLYVGICYDRSVIKSRLRENFKHEYYRMFQSFASFFFFFFACFCVLNLTVQKVMLGLQASSLADVL